MNSVNSYALPNQWDQILTGCNPVDGNIDATLTDVYLGEGGDVPPAVIGIFPKASAGYLEEWKTQMVGLEKNEQKSFKISSEDAYSTGVLAGKELFFDITILDIPTGQTITARNSVVTVLYSLYVDCVNIESSGVFTSPSGSESEPDYTFIIAGIIMGGLAVISGLGLYIARSDKKYPSNEQLESVAKRQDAQMQNLMKTLDQHEDKISGSKSKKISPQSPKRPSTRRRRR